MLNTEYERDVDSDAEALNNLTHKVEAEWRWEFERFGEDYTRDSLWNGHFDEAKRQFAYRWLDEHARARLRRERRIFRYLQLTLAAAIAAVIICIIHAVVTFSH